MTSYVMIAIALINVLGAVLEDDALLRHMYILSSNLWFVGSMIVSTLEKRCESK